MAIEVFSNTNPKEAIKDRDVFIYARVSGAKQEGTLPTQIKAVKDSLRGMGYRKAFKGRIFQEQASGTVLERPELAKAIEAMKNHPRPAILVVRDIQRFSRDPYGLGALYRQMWEQDIPLASLTENLVLGTQKNPSPNADLLGPILIAIGGQEVNLRKKQSLVGRQAAKAKGISGGQPMRVYSNEPLNPYRELVRLLAVGIGQKTGSTRLGRSGSWWRKNRDKIDRIRRAKGDDGVEEFLSLTDKIREMEQEFGPRFGRSVRRQGMVAVSRMTSLYLSEPERVERPTDEEVDEYFTNFKEYLNPKKS